MNDITKLAPIAAPPYLDKRTRPIWMQIYDRLGAAIADGTLPEGTRLPGEEDLAQLFKVSRITLRRALARHRNEGRLLARKGVGVFVRSKSARYVVRQAEAFHDTMTDSEFHTETLSLGRKPASPGAAQSFGLAAGAEVIELRQRGLVGTVPIYLAVKEFPLDLFPDFEAAYARTGTVLGAYASGGVHAYSRKQTRVFGDLARDAEAELLQLERGAPIIRSRSINTSPSGAVIECNRGCWPLHGVELVFGEDPASSG